MNLLKNPAALAFVVPLVLLIVKRVADVRATAAKLRTWPGVEKQVRQRAPVRLSLALAALAMSMLAVAGPQFDMPVPIDARPTRDLVVVLDLSRSMTAEQPSRLDKSVRALRTLAETMRRHGEVRVALIAFAAQPELVFPLTADPEHLRHILDRIVEQPPIGIRPGGDAPFASGTRIGAALRLALADGPREIVLVSDGDDPVDDDEWQAGIAAARAVGATVHTVAVGEPGVEATIPYRSDVLRYEDQTVRTRVRSDRLEEIARRTGGQHFVAAKGTLALGSLLHDHWRSLPSVGDSVSKFSEIPVVRGPFLLLALLAWLASWVRFPTRRAVPAMVALLAVGLIAAQPGPGDWRRQGHAALTRRDFDEAIRCFRNALALADADDPGQIAFELGVAYFRKGEFAESAHAYRLALGDDAIPAERGRRAWFDRGNALLHQAGTTERRLLQEAMAAYRRCLATEAAQPDAELRRDAVHNLELAGRRWLKTQPPPASEGNDSGDPSANAKGKDDPTNSGTAKSIDGDPRDPKTTGNGDPNADPKGDGNSKAARGSITVLPDQAERAPLTADDAALHLERALDRIARQRPLGHVEIGPLRGKDW